MLNRLRIIAQKEIDERESLMRQECFKFTLQNIEGCDNEACKKLRKEMKKKLKEEKEYIKNHLAQYSDGAH